MANNLPPEVVDALRRGNKIEAIKLLREAIGVGLAEAKGLVDHHEAGGGARPAGKPAAARPAAARPVHAPTPAPRRDGLSPGEEPRSSNPATVIAVILFAALALWLYSQYG
jgi:hypothetical protein